MSTIDNACNAIHAVLMPYGEVSAEQIKDICDILHGKKCAVDKDDQQALEPPMSCEEAARLLKVTKQTIHYHARHGRIRRVLISGSSRARGFVAADIRAILRGGTK